MRAWVLGTVIALIALGVGAVFGDRGILSMVGEREKIGALRAELESLRAENARLSGEIADLRLEPARDRAARARGARPRTARRDRVPDQRRFAKPTAPEGEVHENP